MVQVVSTVSGKDITCPKAKFLFLNDRNDSQQLLKGETKLFPVEKLMESAKYEISEVPINEYSWHMNLKILNVQKHDFGSYVCASVNALGKVEGDVRLQGKFITHSLRTALLHRQRPFAYAFGGVISRLLANGKTGSFFVKLVKVT